MPWLTLFGHYGQQKAHGDHNLQSRKCEGNRENSCNEDGGGSFQEYDWKGCFLSIMLQAVEQWPIKGDSDFREIQKPEGVISPSKIKTFLKQATVSITGMVSKVHGQGICASECGMNKGSDKHAELFCTRFHQRNLQCGDNPCSTLRVGEKYHC